MKTLFAILLMCLMASAAMAEGTEFQVGEPLTFRCNPPTTFADGSPIPAGTAITIKAYATQNPPNVGTPLGSGNCPLVVPSDGLTPGQYQGYATASIEGRPESALSTAVPFYMAPPATVPPAAPELQAVEH